MAANKSLCSKRLTIGYGASVAVLAAALVVGCKTGDLVSGGGDFAPPGTIIFNDPSPIPSDNTPPTATMLGREICQSCHGRSTSAHPNGIIAEWLTTPHGNDPSTLAGNLFTRTVADGDFPGSPCSACHTTGSPNSGDPLGSVNGGFDTSQAYDSAHNQKFWGIQCEACHGPGSAHVAAGGAPNLINRVPNAKKTCWGCHANAPNTKGATITGPATDAYIAKYSTSLARSHAAGALATGTGGYEYAGVVYKHAPHPQIANTCQTCHAYRMRNRPSMDHTTVAVAPQKETCAFCHGGAANASDLGHVVVNPQGETLEEIMAEITGLIIQLGGVTGTGAIDRNAAGGALKAYLDAGGSKSDDKYKRARWNHSYVLNDASFGAHDYDYAKQLLETSIANLQAP